MIYFSRFSGEKKGRGMYPERQKQVSGLWGASPPPPKTVIPGAGSSPGLPQGTRWLFTPIPGGEGRPSAEMPWRCALGSRSETRDTLARRGAPPPVRSSTASEFTGSLTPPPASPSGPTDSRFSGLQLLPPRPKTAADSPRLPFRPRPQAAFPVRATPVGTAQSALILCLRPQLLPGPTHTRLSSSGASRARTEFSASAANCPLRSNPQSAFLAAHFGRTPTPLPPEIIQTPSDSPLPETSAPAAQKKKKNPLRLRSNPKLVRRLRRRHLSQRRPRWKSKYDARGGLNGPGGGHLNSALE